MTDRPIYLDHHSTTPVDPRVVEAMLPYFTERFGNASSIHHAYGREAAEAISHAREQVARLINAGDASEIVFTSGATEANNLAIKGIAAFGKPGDHLISSAVEHRAVLDPLRRLAREQGRELTLVLPNPTGWIAPNSIKEALTPRTAFVSVMAANNEIGTMNPIHRIGEICREQNLPFHTDASQRVGKVPIDVQASSIDLLSLTAHKFHGPKGIGALYVRKGVRLRGQVDGGGHERGLRSGTLPVLLVVGLGEAARIATEEVDSELRRLGALRNRLYTAIREQLGEGVRLNGPKFPDRLPNNLHLSFIGVDGQALLANLRGLAVSSGAACSSAEPGPSHVLRAIGLDDRLAEASLRFGLGRFTTANEVDQAAEIVTRTVIRLRQPTCDPPPGA